MTLLVFAAVLFRATLLMRAPDVSDDLQRYLWDARVASAGISPWAYAPDDSRLAAVAPRIRAGVAHREVRTVYPPVAEAVFWAGSAGGTRPRALRAVFAAADVLIVWLLARRGSGFAAALYAFHPLPILEGAGQGHVDAVGVALLLAALGLLQARRRGLSGVALAMSSLTKYVALAASLPLLRRGGWRLAGASAALAGAAWFAGARLGASPAGGLFDYASRWDFNSVLYPAAVSAIRSAEIPARAKTAFLGWKERLGHPAWTQALFPYFYDGFFARMALAAAAALILLAIARRVADPRRAAFASLAALLLCSPTLQPWYLLWTLPFAAEMREPAFLYLSFAVPLSYGLLYPGLGGSPARILAFEYAPFALLLTWTLARAARRRIA